MTTPESESISVKGDNTMKFVLEINIKDGDDAEQALHDAAVMVRCRLKGIRQQGEFWYLNGNSVRLLPAHEYVHGDVKESDHCANCGADANDPEATAVCG